MKITSIDTNTHYIESWDKTIIEVTVFVKTSDGLEEFIIHTNSVFGDCEDDILEFTCSFQNEAIQLAYKNFN